MGGLFMITIKKTTTLVLFSIFLLALIPFSSHASNVPAIMPRWNGIGDESASLVFYGNEGEAVATIGKVNPATSLEGTLTVYKYINGEWICVDSVTKSTTRATLNIVIVFDGTSGVEYKLELFVTAYNGTTVIEEITDTKYARCP